MIRRRPSLTIPAACTASAASRATPVALCAALAVAACSLPTASSSPAVEVRTGSSAYTIDAATGTASIDFSIRNRGPDLLHIARCGADISAVVDRRGGTAGWQQYASAICLTVHDMTPLELPPGQTAHGTAVIAAPGEYRLRIGGARAASQSPEWNDASNSFTVH
jgi:hypothetical protein